MLQLIYQIWLPAREKTGILDLYGGPLDSVIWRVTLSPEGTPIAFDSIHGCGCYYLLFPSQGYRAIPPKDGAEPVLSPKAIATISPGQRLLLRLQSRTHYLQQTSLSDDTIEATIRSYIFQELEQLRSLQMPNGPIAVCMVKTVLLMPANAPNAFYFGLTESPVQVLCGNGALTQSLLSASAISMIPFC